MIINNDVDVTQVYHRLVRSKAEINVFRGGTGSSKSYSAAQFFIINKLCNQTGKKIVIARKTLPALKKTAYWEVMELLKQYQIPYKENKTDLEYHINGNILYFLSIDNPDKVASLNTDDVWLEEGTDFTFKDFMQFYLRLKGQIYFTFNPVDQHHWINQILVQSGKYNVYEDVSTYRDNQFLAPQRVRRIEQLIDQDENYYRIYNLGEWGSLKNLIYSGFKVVDIPARSGEITYGLDFGFNHPSCLVKIYWKDNRFISQELLYKSRLTNSELIDEVKLLVPASHRQKYMYADSAEPARIEDFFKAGFNIHPADKSVRDGLDYVKQHSNGITSDSVNGIKEKQAYSYKEDKNGDPIGDEPIKIMDDFCDAERYGAYTYSKIVIPEVSIL